MFISDASLADMTWQGFERAIFRLLIHEGHEGVRLVGRSNDGGADLLARIAGKQWLFQVKKWGRPVGHAVIEETLRARQMYRADVPVIVALNGFEERVQETRRVLMSEGIPLQLWDRKRLMERARNLADASPVDQNPAHMERRTYQEEAIQEIVRVYLERLSRRALTVMATGLGKTLVAAEAIRRISRDVELRVLAIAHTNDLVYQLERAFWPLLRAREETVVWNGYERPKTATLERATFVFACIDTVASAIERNETLPPFDVILVDECHHAAASMYESVIRATRAGEQGGPFLLGLTATPWRGDGQDIERIFGAPLVAIDLITGMRKGFLTNVDYRIYTSNIDWSRLSTLRGEKLSPRGVNRTLFISEWDDSVVLALQAVWHEQKNSRALVFCGTIDHALQMRDRINALGFCHAEAVFSTAAPGLVMQPWERNRILADFDGGRVGVVCAVDIFNEGIDVPDVNIIVFQRVTHSRRIFVQQLGRGLRIARGKEKVIVLDFVSDIRRFAAGIELKDRLSSAEPTPARGAPVRVRLKNKVTFVRVGGEDPETESFLRQWLEDVASVEGAGDDAAVLKYPPALPSRP